MPLRRDLLLALTLGIIVSFSGGTAVGQLPSTPVPPPNTLWSFLGLPQGYRTMHDGMFNRRGNFPGLERKPPLKALADPANLKSDIPEIKAAAEIKQAEDLAPQKVKAIKYLGQVGCGCYDKDGKVTKALVAAMGDCTEDVRAAAVEAISEGAEDEMCAKCKQRSCCNPKVSEQLAKLAYERDSTGCWTERSERVRQAAAAALRVCCPSSGPPAYEPAPAPPGKIESGEGAGKIESSESGESVKKPPVKDPPQAKPGEDVPPQPPADVQTGEDGEDEATSLAASSRRNPQRFVQRALATTPVDAAASAAGQDGAIVSVDADGKLARVHFPDRKLQPRPGTTIGVYTPVDGKYRLLGELEVTESGPGSAVIRPVGDLDLSVLSAGAVLAGWE